MADDNKSDSSVDQNLIRELAKLLDETNLTEIEIERSGLRVRVARGGGEVGPAPPTYGRIELIAKQRRHVRGRVARQRSARNILHLHLDRARGCRRGA